MNAKEIKEIRKSLNLSQEEFAKLIGVSKNTVYNYENGSKIPESKITILNKIKTKEHISVNESTTTYETGHDKKIHIAEEKIKILEEKLELNKNFTEGEIQEIKGILEQLYREIRILKTAKNDWLEQNLEK